MLCYWVTSTGIDCNYVRKMVINKQTILLKQSYGGCHCGFPLSVDSFVFFLCLGFVLFYYFNGMTLDVKHEHPLFLCVCNNLQLKWQPKIVKCCRFCSELLCSVAFCCCCLCVFGCLVVWFVFVVVPVWLFGFCVVGGGVLFVCFVLFCFHFCKPATLSFLFGYLKLTHSPS